MIKAPASFNGRFVTRHLFRNYLEHSTLSLINSGRCYDFAYYAYRLFPNVKLWTTDYHAWVEARGKHWDSETSHGVKDYMKLRCNVRNTYGNSFPCPWDEQEPVTMEVDEFKSFWDRNGSGRRHHWDNFLEPELKAALGKRYSEMTPIFGEAK
jgi:hypothetical protein